MLPNARIAAVTGAGTGIGKSAVINLLDAGYSVALAGRRLEPLLETINESGVDESRAIAVSTDVSDVTSIRSFFEAIKRVSIFSNKSTHQVALSLESGSVKIRTEDPEKSSKAEESLSAEYEGEPIVIGYNAEYLKDIISHVRGKTIEIELNTPVSAALFNPESQKNEQSESLMLLMPIRLND